MSKLEPEIIYTRHEKTKKIGPQNRVVVQSQGVFYCLQYLFHQRDGRLVDNPRDRTEHTRRALCAWCSIPDAKTATPKAEWQFQTDFRDLHEEFSELVDANGGGWFWRHVHHVADFVEANPSKVSKSARNNSLKIKKGFDAAWRNKVQQFQVSIFSPGTKGQWIIRFDDLPCFQGTSFLIFVEGIEFLQTQLPGKADSQLESSSEAGQRDFSRQHLMSVYQTEEQFPVFLVQAMAQFPVEPFGRDFVFRDCSVT